ncbi:MAG: AAA family ATPase [Acidobacteriaceae bacterium]
MTDQRIVDTERSMSVISMLLDEDSRATLHAAINAVGGFFFKENFQQYIGQKNDAAVVRAVNEEQADICIVDFDRDRELAIRTVEYLRQSAGGNMSIFAASTSTDPDSIISAMRCGCTEYLTKPLQLSRLTESLLEIAKKRRQSMAPKHQGKISTFIGVKGGAGVTTLAVHFAYCLAKSNHHTLLIDQHPELGDTTIHLGIDHYHYHFYELLQNLQRLDSELLQGFVIKHNSGLELLASPESLGSIPSVASGAIPLTLRFLKSTYEHIVVDCAPGFNEWNTSTIAASDEIFLVATQDIPSIRNLARSLDHLSTLNFPGDKVQIVINRFSKKNPISIQHIEKAIQKDIFMTIPEAHMEIIEAINSGTPVEPKSKSDFIQGINKWIQMVDTKESSQVSVKDSNARQPRLKYGILGI